MDIIKIMQDALRMPLRNAAIRNGVAPKLAARAIRERDQLGLPVPEFVLLAAQDPMFR